MSTPDLLGEWAGLLERRPSLATTLAPYGEILEMWAGWPLGRVAPLGWSAADCAARWEQGRPLLAGEPPPVSPDEAEALLGPVMELLAAIDPEEAASLQRFAEAWDRGDLDVRALLPEPGRIGSGRAVAAAGVSGELLGFLACASLRPILEAYFAECRPHLAEGTWSLGTCPFCGAPPAFADLIEDGRRRLACHLCGGGWIFSRARCPFCGTLAARDLIRLLPDRTEEGYAVEACRPCGGFVKELDRRVRWNGGSALVEDWGSPHLDLVAERAGYRRAVPTLVQLQRPR